MCHSGDSEIIEARRLLASFEQNQTSNEGIACLSDALAEGVKFVV